MADGAHNKQMGKMNTGFIAYQDEEHGLGYKVAQNLCERTGGGRPSRRSTTSDTLSALITNKASKAVIPLENDRGGYDTATLSPLLDFKDYVITEERSDHDNYSLAAPATSIHEIAQAAYPGTYDGKAAVGPFPRDKQLQNSFRKRVEIVYASTDAFDRCEATIDELRAEGIEVRKINEGTDPYREVLSMARQGLDPDRKIRTQIVENKTAMYSDTTAANFNKPLIGVLLPQDVAVGVNSGYNNATGIAHGAEFNGDYVILEDQLADRGADISTRFLVLERKAPAKKAGGQKPVKTLSPRAQLTKKFDNMTTRYGRALLKVDTRGEKTGNVADITNMLVEAGIHFRQIDLHERPETLPSILEIELDLHGLSGNFDAQKKVLGQVWDKAFNKSRNHDPALLAVYGTDTSAFDGVIMPKKSGSGMEGAFGVIALILVLAGAAALAWSQFS